MKSPFTVKSPKKLEEYTGVVVDPLELKRLKKKGWRITGKKKDKLFRKKKDSELFEEEIALFFKENLKFESVELRKKYGVANIDVAAFVDDIFLVIECKTKEKTGNKDINDYITKFTGKKRTIAKAIRKKFGNKFKEIKFILALRDIEYNEKNENHAKDNDVYLWGDKYIEILKILYTIFGSESRYSFLKELDISKIPIRDGAQRYYEVPALRLKQKGVNIYNFFIEANKLLKLSYVARLESNKADMYQRLVNKSRLSKVAKFIEEENGTFKNNIIVSFEHIPPKPKIIKSLKSENNLEKLDMIMLKIPKFHQSLWVIDGQHRLYGFTRVSDYNRNKYLSVTAIEDADMSEQARTFVDINHNQKPVDSNLLWDLFDRLKPGQEEGAISSLVKRLATTSGSIFKGKIYIPGIAKRKRKSFKIFFSNFCKGILDRGIIDADDRVSIYNLIKKEGYSDLGVKKAADIINSYFKIIVHIAEIKAHKPKWVDSFIMTNNGLNIFLRVFIHCIDYFDNKLSPGQVEALLGKSLRSYFVENVNRIDELRQEASSEGTREKIAYSIVRVINSNNHNFAKEYVLSKDKELLETDPYKTLIELEKKLRQFTVKKLSMITKDWWKQRIPFDIRTNAEENLKRGNRPDPYTYIKPRDKMDCLDFMDYPKIFVEGNNWRDVFENIFSDRERVNVLFKEMRPMRVKIAHGNDYSDEEKEDFLRNCKKLLRIVNR